MRFILLCSIAIIGSLGIYLADLSTLYQFAFLGILFFFVPLALKEDEKNKASKIRNARIIGTLFLTYVLLILIFNI